MKYIDERAPAEPNVFTDGAMSNPSCQLWSLLGVGIWWPGRKYIDHELSHQELKYSSGNKETNEGVQLWACMKGYRGSSTRAEIAAIILAMMTPRAIHVATDSSSAKHGFDTLLNYLLYDDLRDKNKPHYEEWPMGKNWSLLNDGDLWHQAWTLMVQRGQASMRITKVKGHARDIDVEQSDVLKVFKTGNDIADLAADEGLESNGDGKASYGSYLHRRQKQYVKLVEEIQTMVLEVLKLSIEKREQRNKSEDPIKKYHGKKKEKS